MMPLDDYRALEETAHLLRSPANARQLSSAIEQLPKEIPRSPFEGIATPGPLRHDY
jgi:Txe/YoeB family toxin of Txe-Axe toxin-antitoxin module